jgi:hypothetical protein
MVGIDEDLMEGGVAKTKIGGLAHSDTACPPTGGVQRSQEKLK